MEQGGEGGGCSERDRPGAGLELTIEGMWRRGEGTEPLSTPRPGKQPRLASARTEASAPSQLPLLATLGLARAGFSLLFPAVRKEPSGS